MFLQLRDTYGCYFLSELWFLWICTFEQCTFLHDMLKLHIALQQQECLLLIHCKWLKVWPSYEVFIHSHCWWKKELLTRVFWILKFWLFAQKCLKRPNTFPMQRRKFLLNCSDIISPYQKMTSKVFPLVLPILTHLWVFFKIQKIQKLNNIRAIFLRVLWWSKRLTWSVKSQKTRFF